MYTLVVIDMQVGFESANRSYTEFNVLKAIKSARSDNADIILVSLDKFGPLLNSIRSYVHGYDNLDYVTKYADDGGREISDCIENNYFCSEKIKVCGVNTDACVMETVLSLSAFFPDSSIELIENACNSMDYNDFSWAYEIENVIII